MSKPVVDSERLSTRTSFQLEYEFLDTSDFRFGGALRFPHQPICIKYQDENVLGVDTSELKFRGVRNLSCE